MKKSAECLSQADFFGIIPLRLASSLRGTKQSWSCTLLEIASFLAMTDSVCLASLKGIPDFFCSTFVD
jgi:hypothetical protein